MGPRRVGIVSDNSSLFVALTLRADGIEFTRATDVAGLGGHDVVVLDVPEGRDANVLAMDVPAGPAIVVLTDEDTMIEGATVVPRPYAVGDLLDLLRTIAPDNRAPVRPPIAMTQVLFTNDKPPVAASRSSESGDRPSDEVVPLSPGPSSDDLLIVLNDEPRSVPGPLPVPVDEPQVVMEPAGPLFDHVASASADESATPTPGAGALATAERTAMQTVSAEMSTDDGLDVLDLETDDPIIHVWQLAHALDLALGKAEFLASMGVLADRLAASLAREHDAAHVALWHRAQDSYTIVGAAGLTSVARRDVVAADHPAIVELRSQGGILVEQLTHRMAHTRTLPGARSPRYGCVLVERDAVPIHLVTMSGQHIDYDQLIAVSDAVVEATQAWGAAAAVERLRSRLGMV